MAINWTMGITIIGSFGAALSAQMAANFFTNRREDKKYDRECFQSLYSPLSLKIIEYVYLENYKSQIMSGTAFNAESFEQSSENPEPKFKVIMEYIGRDLKYALPEIIMEYEYLKADVLDFSGDRDFGSRMNFCRMFLLEYVKLSNKLNVLSKAVEERVIPPLFYSFFYLLLEKCEFWELIKESMTSLYLIEKVVLKKDNNNLLDRITAIQHEINYVKEENVNQHRYEEAFTDAYHFIYEFIDKCSAVNDYGEEIAKHWREILEKELEYKPFPERILA